MKTAYRVGRGDWSLEGWCSDLFFGWWVGRLMGGEGVGDNERRGGGRKSGVEGEGVDLGGGGIIKQRLRE